MRNMSKKFLWIALFILPGFMFADAQWKWEGSEDFHVEVHLPDRPLTLQDPIVVRIVAVHPPQYQLDMQALKESLEIVDVSLQHEKHSSIPLNPSSIQSEIVLHLEAWVPGEYAFAFLPLRFISQDKSVEPIEVHSTLLSFKVLATDPNAKSLTAQGLLALDNRPLMQLSARQKESLRQSEKAQSGITQQILSGEKATPWKWMLACFATLLTVVAFRFYSAKLKRRGVNEIVDMRQRAMAALSLLENENFPEKGLYSLFYVELTAIIRQYIEGQYQLKAPERTTEEFLEEAATQALFDEKLREILKELLTFADLVKFARHDANIENCQTALQGAKQFILSGAVS